MNQETTPPRPAQRLERIDVFTPRDFAAQTGIPYRGILTAIRSGELRCLRRNARWFRIRSEDGARWIASLTGSTYQHKQT